MDLGDALFRVFGVLVPAATAVLGVYANLLARRRGRVFRDFISREDELEDEALDEGSAPKLAPDADGASSERTPLLNIHHREGRNKNRRSTRNLTLIIVGFVEFATRLALLVRSVAGTEDAPATDEMLVLKSWAYATFLPLLKPSVTPYYSLLTIYTSNVVASCFKTFLALVPAPQSVVTANPWRWSLLLDLGHPALCLVALFVLLGMPVRESDALPEKNAEDLHPAMDDWSTLGQWLTVSWLNPLVTQGRRVPLEEADVWQLARGLRSRVVFRKFQLVSGGSFMMRLFKANSRDLVISAVYTLCATTLQLAQPVILNRVLQAMEQAPAAEDTPPLTSLPLLTAQLGLSSDAAHGDTRSAYLWVGVAFLAMLFKAEVDLQNFFIGRRAALRAKSETVASIYQKALKRIDTSGTVGDGMGTGGGADLGKITSLVSNDSSHFSYFMNIYTQVVQAPLAIALSATFLYHLMGWSAFVGYAALLFATPANHFLMKFMYSQYRAVLELRDRRMQRTNEAVQAARFIKLSAWERRWAEKVLFERERELQQVVRVKVTLFFINFVWDVVPILIACISLTSFTYFAGHELSVSIAVPALLTFSILTDELTALPRVANTLQNTRASINRIGDFLEEEEVPQPEEDESALAYDERLGFEGATLAWHKSAVRAETLLKRKQAATRRSWAQMLTLRANSSPSQPSVTDTTSSTPEAFTLRDLSLVFPRGAVSLVCGPTGAGKSALLAALLGEMRCLQGRVFLPRLPARVDAASGLRESVSFCAQHPWLEHRTIRDNILFGSPYDKARYDAVLSACALVPDLKMCAPPPAPWLTRLTDAFLRRLEDGDRTEIGEKGIALSGGQKARVALARAVYASSQTVLLDDVLSAVDTHTADILIRRCFAGPLMRGRTVVLATHHVEAVAPLAAFVVRLENGMVAAQGTPAQLRARGDAVFTGTSKTSESRGQEDSDQGPVEALVVDEVKEAKKLVEVETKASGSVKVNVYLLYLQAAGYWIVGLLFLVVLLKRIMDLGQQFWIKAWSESYESHALGAELPKSPFGLPSATQNPLPYIAVYVGIQSFNAICTMSVQIPNMYSALFASRSLYRRMLEGVLRSPIRWFDKTPAGRILNRFSKDIDTIDGGLSYYVWQVAEQVVAFLISVGTITYGVPPFVIFAVFLGYLHYYIANGYIKTSRDLNRLESTLRSPIISAFGELLVGVTTVRAFGAETRFMQLLFERLDRCQAAFYYTWMTNFWLRFRFGVLGSLTFFCTAVLALTIGIEAGLMAIVITQAQTIIGTFYWGMRAYVEAEQAFNGIERVGEFIQLPSEPPLITEKRPPPNWPSEQGAIEFKSVAIKYDTDLDLVLKNISFTILPREKIGLVGRTGSGKSTLALSLFRFVDATEGTISIDGVDITTIGVEDLRSRLTLIPQDAVLFKGTIRENLDPFNEYTDAECLDVLRAVQLPLEKVDGGASSGESTIVASEITTPRPGAGTSTVVTLDSPVSEGGHNYSAGQRQLLAMARALLRKTRTVVLDESTASVDFETDKKIQQAIRDGFADGIVIIIAHRLHTIIQCDRIMVLDAGRIVEFDAPLSLLEKEGGVFRGMCEASDAFDTLYTSAKVTA